MKKVFEGVVDYQSAAGGLALVSEGISEPNGDPNTGMFVRVQSWDETRAHKDARRFDNKRVRITLELLDEDPA